MRRSRVEEIAWARAAGRRIGEEMRVLVERDRRRQLKALQYTVASDRKAARVRREGSKQEAVSG